MKEERLNKLKSELMMTKHELQQRLTQEKIDTYQTEFAQEWNGWSEEKRKYFLHTIQDDLADIEVALQKMNEGTYGICEETGKEIPYHLLESIPTARSFNDFYYVWV